MEKVAVVILNWNGKSFLQKFLPSVTSFSQYENTQIYVADNGSTDTSISFLKINYPDIKIIELPVNYGFAGGYNEALKQVDAEYYVILNSDVEVTENWIDPVIDYMDKNPKTAACQPKILAHYNKESFEHAGAAGGRGKVRPHRQRGDAGSRSLDPLLRGSRARWPYRYLLRLRGSGR